MNVKIEIYNFKKYENIDKTNKNGKMLLEHK